MGVAAWQAKVKHVASTRGTWHGIRVCSQAVAMRRGCASCAQVLPHPWIRAVERVHEHNILCGHRNANHGSQTLMLPPRLSLHAAQADTHRLSPPCSRWRAAAGTWRLLLLLQLQALHLPAFQPTAVCLGCTPACFPCRGCFKLPFNLLLWPGLSCDQRGVVLLSCCCFLRAHTAGGAAQPGSITFLSERPFSGVRQPVGRCGVAMP